MSIARVLARQIFFQFSTVATKVAQVTTAVPPVPLKMHLKENKFYLWCQCERSAELPMCDGKHVILNKRGMGKYFKPLKFWGKGEDALICTCTKTKTAPYCDCVKSVVA